MSELIAHLCRWLDYQQLRLYGLFFTNAPEHVYISLSGIESAITHMSKPEKGLGGTKNKRACYAKGNKK